MSVTGTAAEVVKYKHPIPGMPPNTNYFRALAQATGNGSGGSIACVLNFNPESSVNFQRFVTIRRWVALSRTASPVGAMSVQPTNTHFEDFENLASCAVDVAEWKDTGTAEQDACRSNQVLYLGRVKKGTLGQVSWYGQNVNTQSIRLLVEGYISDSPIQFDWSMQKDRYG